MSDAAALRDTLAARGIEDVMLVSATHAAAALAQAVGRAIGYDTTALLFIEKDTATMSVVQTDDGSVVKVLSRDLHDSDAMAVLTEMAAAVESAESPPQGLFVVGSGVDASSVKAHLENLVALPVSAPDEPELALARGAALASAHAPEMEASTAGLAYSQDPDGTTAGKRLSGAGRRGHAAGSGRRPCRVLRGAGIFRRARGPGVRTRAALPGRGPQAVPARRQRADVDLRGRRCRPGDFARGQHPPDGRPAAQPRRDAGHSEPGRACPAPQSSSRPSPRPRPPLRRRRRPSRRPCRWCSRPRRKRHGRCSSRSPRRVPAAPAPAPAAPPPVRGPAAAVPSPRWCPPILAPPIYNPPAYYPPRPVVGAAVAPPPTRRSSRRGSRHGSRRSSRSLTSPQ